MKNQNVNSDYEKSCQKLKESKTFTFYGELSKLRIASNAVQTICNNADTEPLGNVPDLVASMKETIKPENIPVDFTSPCSYGEYAF